MTSLTRYLDSDFPSVVPTVCKTDSGISYLESPGVVIVSVPYVNIAGLKGFLEGFPADLGFSDYLKDPVRLTPAEELCKAAGQLCYLSFGTCICRFERQQRYDSCFDNWRRRVYCLINVRRFYH